MAHTPQAGGSNPPRGTNLNYITMVIKSKKDHQKILNAGFVILRLRVVQDVSGKKVYSVWAKTKDKDWHNLSIPSYSKRNIQEYLDTLLKGPLTILEG